MSTHDNGGPAFPVTTEQYDYGHERVMPKQIAPGMTLRDYFAAKAMASYRVAQWKWYSSVGVHGKFADPDQVATWAYADADAMLRAREGS